MKWGPSGASACSAGIPEHCSFLGGHHLQAQPKAGLEPPCGENLGGIQGSGSHNFRGTPCRGGFLTPMCMQRAGHPQNSSHLLKWIFFSENQLDLVLLFELTGWLWWWEVLYEELSSLRGTVGDKCG